MGGGGTGKNNTALAKIAKAYGSIKARQQNFHPTVKPIKLMAYLITLGSRPGDIVLDPFVGSGTTCIAAKMLGRKYVGIDLEKQYVKIAKARVKCAARSG